VSTVIRSRFVLTEDGWDPPFRIASAGDVRYAVASEGLGMRTKKASDEITVKAIAGTYVVSLAMDATDDVRTKLLGFAFYRVDQTEHEEYWLKGLRTFEETTPPNLPAGTLVSTNEQPIQDFAWGDFTAKPGHEYIYRVYPVYGKPKALQLGKAVELTVTTESEAGEDGNGAKHRVYFNRGVIGSQAYAREFHNEPPDQLQGKEQDEAFQWLSRGLEEAMLAFIAQGARPGYGLRAAVYEFSYEPAISAFGDAAKKGKDVQIVYDARRPSGTSKSAKEAGQRVDAVEKLLKKYGLTRAAIPRTQNASYIAHNKFIVLLQEGEPVAVWTGSTNFTESGIFGQSNVGHAVYDPDVAKVYLDYWEALSKDPPSADIKKTTAELTPDIDGKLPPVGCTPIFSPRTGLSSLEWYAQAMKNADAQVDFTAAFGVNQAFLDVLGQKRPILRYVFLEKWGVSAQTAAATQKALGADVFNQVAVGAFLGQDVLEDYLKRRFLVELKNPISENVKYTHTKYLLLDPLGDDPIVITGSANFSNASTTNNDENMLVIRGDTRVADIYFGEFMRLWQHYRFRGIVNDLKKSGPPKANYLSADPSWTDAYYKKGTVKYAKRTTLVR
jgi:phosphatidylserine/phosphatidylglycerophosphate/cardiolipin synthase-like enzyme